MTTRKNTRGLPEFEAAPRVRLAIENRSAGIPVQVEVSARMICVGCRGDNDTGATHCRRCMVASRATH
jgi:hypothetical protein